MIQEAPRRYQNVLVWVDDSSACSECVRHGAAEAARSGGTLHLVHACTPPWMVLHYKSPPEGNTPEYQARFRRMMEHRLRHSTRCVVRDHPSLHVVYAQLFGAVPGEDVLDYAKSIKADLLVIHCKHPHRGLLEKLRERVDGTEHLRREAPGAMVEVRDRSGAVNQPARG